MTLGSVPDAEFERWQELGFTHIWLMGVWPTGQRSRAAALSSQGMRRAFNEALPGSRFEELASAGHISNLDQPEGFTRAVKDFLAAK